MNPAAEQVIVERKGEHEPQHLLDTGTGEGKALLTPFKTRYGISHLRLLRSTR